MTVNDKIDILAFSKAQEEQQKKLDAKYKDMTHCEALDGFYWWCKQFILFLQALSICLGMGFPLMLADRMPSVSALVFSIGFIFIVVLESAKGWTMDEINRLRIINIPKAVKIPMKRFLFAAVVLFGLNVAIGFWSSPFIVEILVEPKGIVSIAEIDSIYSKKKETERIRFEAIKLEFKAQADTIKTINTKVNGTLKSAALRPHAEMMRGVARQLDSLNAMQSILTREHSNKIQAAENDNAETMKEHKAFCNSFSFWAALGAGVIEFFLTILAYWIADFDHKKRGELASAKELIKAEDEHKIIPKIEAKEVKEKVEAKEVEKIKVVDNQDKTPIGFVHNEGESKAKEGDIVKGEGKQRDRVLVFVSGTLTPKTKGELNTLIKGQSTAERIKHLESLKNKLP